MAILLIAQVRPEDRRADGQHSFLVNAVDEAAARELAGVPTSWTPHQIAETGALPLDPLTETAVDALAIEGRTRSCPAGPPGAEIL